MFRAYGRLLGSWPETAFGDRWDVLPSIAQMISHNGTSGTFRYWLAYLGEARIVGSLNALIAKVTQASHHPCDLALDDPK